MNDFVALDVCPYCGQPKAIAIHKNLKSLPQPCMTSPEPCDTCKVRFTKTSIFLLIYHFKKCFLVNYGDTKLVRLREL